MSDIFRRVRKTPPTDVSPDRYEFLSLREAEPDLGVPPGENYILSSLPDGTRVWIDSTVFGSSGIGPSGYSGFSGPAGGPSGTSGYSGFSGTPGASGFSGLQGFSGFSGSQGTSGFSGYSGVEGASGFSGYSGPLGQSGFSGYSGPLGQSGFSGYSGISGYSGSGISGFSGYSGVEGVSGFSGYSGPVGTSGFSGYSGLAGDRYATTSTTSLTIGTGSKTLTVGTGLAYTPSQPVRVANTSTAYMEGTITSYNSGTGNLVVNVTVTSGSGTYSSWDINLAGAVGAEGASGFSGYSGATGAGTSGFSGFSGYSGIDGVIGGSGFSGYSGVGGISGFSGFSGATGAGTSGFSGFSGAGGGTLSDDTTTDSSHYPVIATTTSGSLTPKVSSTKLYYNPSTGTLNATVFNSLSDLQQKENIATISNALAKTLNLRGVSFTFKDTNQKSIGVIAQEVEQIIPEAVHTSTNGEKSVTYGNLIGLLIEAIKEMQLQIDELRNSNAKR